MGKRVEILSSGASVFSDPWVDLPLPTWCWSWQVGAATSITCSLALWLGQGPPLPPVDQMVLVLGFPAFEAPVFIYPL